MQESEKSKRFKRAMKQIGDIAYDCTDNSVEALGLVFQAALTINAVSSSKALLNLLEAQKKAIDKDN